MSYLTSQSLGSPVTPSCGSPALGSNDCNALGGRRRQTHDSLGFHCQRTPQGCTAFSLPSLWSQLTLCIAPSRIPCPVIQRYFFLLRKRAHTQSCQNGVCFSLSSLVVLAQCVNGHVPRRKQASSRLRACTANCFRLLGSWWASADDKGDTRSHCRQLHMRMRNWLHGVSDTWQPLGP